MSLAKTLVGMMSDDDFDITPELRRLREEIEEINPNAGLKRYHKKIAEEAEMSQQDRYIDARLVGIESKLDARMEAMQRFSEQSEVRNREMIERIERQTEQSEKRFESTTDRLYTEMSGLRSDVMHESINSRRHATQVAIATVASVAAVVALIVTIAGYWISEQGSYAKSYGETQSEIQQAADERAEFREAVQSIQATQLSILERLPQPSDE